MPINKGYKPHYDTAIFKRWSSIRSRTRFRNNMPTCYHGISVCKEWHDFFAFKDWAENSGFRPDLTIDRIDPTKGYEPSNCRWITLAENVRRKRKGNTGKWDRSDRDLKWKPGVQRKPRKYHGPEQYDYPVPRKRKFSEDDVRKIRSMYRNGGSFMGIAREFSANPKSIRNIALRLVYKWLDD